MKKILPLKNILSAFTLAALLVILAACGGGGSNSPNAPSVTGLTPLVAMTGTSVTFSVTGTNLPLTATIIAADAVCAASTASSSNGFSQVCTFGSAGSKLTAVKTTAQGIGFLPSYQIAVAERYLKICNNGAYAGTMGCPANPVFGSGTSEWACTLDKVTNQMWEVKTPNGSGLRAMDNRYTSFDDVSKPQKSIGATVVPPTQAEIDAPTNIIGYANALNGLTGLPPLCGGTTWRWPNVTELLTLLKGSTAPRIDSVYFPNTENESYVTSTPELNTDGTVFATNVNTIVLFEAHNAFQNDYAYQNRDIVRRARLRADPPPPIFSLNDTGVASDRCYQAAQVGQNPNQMVSCIGVAAIALSDKQDGMMGRDVTHNNNTDGKLGFSFSTVGNYAKTECIKDNVTGLMWEGKPTSGLRANTNTYTNFGNNSVGDTSAYVTAVNAQGLCGFSDWRIPKRGELQNIVSYNAANVPDLAHGGPPQDAFDPGWFPNTVVSSFSSAYGTNTSVIGYWTASLYAGNTNSAWRVNPAHGFVAANSRSYSQYNLRLVRGSLPGFGTRYVYSPDGTEVEDIVTGLTWRRCAEGMTWTGSTCTGTASTFTHEQALMAAKNQTGWRLPNIKELSSTFDETQFAPAIDATVFPVTPSKRFWSSTPYVGLSGDVVGASTWVVDFYDGFVGTYSRDTPYYIRLVR
jgi:Protein of unknown function (DUF1566)